LQIQEEEGDQFDWLSNLPDDVLLNIVERLDTAVAARTTILSKRWKQIPLMLSKILINVGSTDNVQERSYDVSRANATMLAAIRSLLEHRSTSPYPIHRLCMQFFLGDRDILIGRSCANIIATQKVGVTEFTISTEKEGKRCSPVDRLAYGSKLNSLVNNCQDAFSCLTRLKLENLRLGESDFPKIFGLCKRLEFLHLDNCDRGYRSLLEVNHPRLRELDIFRSDFERVDLNWLPELTTLIFSSWMSLREPLSFGHVPLLHTVSIRNAALSWHRMLKLSEFLGKATVSNLTLGFEKEKVSEGYSLVDDAHSFPWSFLFEVLVFNLVNIFCVLCYLLQIWVKPEDPRELSQVFSKLRLVNLAAISNECDLTWTMFVLQGAPSLEELCIRVKSFDLLSKSFPSAC
jgi:hypothetical protein